MTISPFIEGLLKLDEQTLQTEIARFWTEKTTFPIVERDTLDDDYVYTTLIYRDGAPNRMISFEIFGTYDENRLGNKRLYHLPGTDLYYRCYKFPNDICFSYRFAITDTVSGETFKTVDRCNPSSIPHGEIKDYSYSVFDLRPPETDWNIRQADVRQGSIDTLRYTDRVVNKNRNIYVYRPAGYDERRTDAYPVIYLFDAFIYLHRVEVPNILDNLINEGNIEPMIAVLFDTYSSTRKDILPLKFDFMKEFVSDVVPLVRGRYNTSSLPEDNIVGGMSYGGLAAAFMAFYHPDVFGKVLGQSSSFWRGFEYLDSEGEWFRDDWLIDQFAMSDKKPLKFFLDWGLQENWVLDSNRKMVKVLAEKAYEAEFVEFNGWHDWSNSRQTFAIGLMYLLE
ncbi:MAG: alpha/beta hydrolase-fold protein [Candidatus Krumholzibacteriia bacterium]